MIAVDFGSGASVPAFTISESDPNYWTLRADFEYVTTMKALYDAEYQITKPEASDFTTFEAGIADGVDDYMDRYEEILQTGASEIVANIPDVLSIMSAICSGGGNAVIASLMQGVLDTMLRHKNTSTTEAGGEDFTAVITSLEEIRDMIEQVLTTFNINIYHELDESSWSVGPVEG